jgi:ketosteroid isomerase-like protein
MPTTELHSFLDATLPHHISAERAIHDGDVSPRLSTWSHADPVTLFGAGVPYRSGWRAVRAAFEWLASTFTACTDYDFELLAAGADGALAYTVGIERYRAVSSSGRAVDNEIRVTHIYRREPEGWKIVHRHGDHLPADVSVEG